MEKERFLCSVCLERFVMPRITKCAHTFCENCLFTFVFETQKKGPVRYFDCPICREKIDLPTAEVTQQWIKDTFPLDIKIKQNMESETESTTKETENTAKETERSYDQGSVDTVMCAPCKESGNENPAAKYCLNCCEALCKTCCEWHKKFKLFKEHEILNLSRAGLLEANTFTDKFEKCTKCNEHTDRNCVSFCLKHKKFCCIQCVMNKHRLCEVSNISDVGNKGKEKANIVADMYHNAGEHIEVLLKLKKENKSSLLLNIDKMSEGVKSLKDELYDSLNRNISSVMSRLKEIRIQVEEGNDNEEKLVGLKEQCETKMKFFQTLKSCKSNEHVFLFSQTMQLEFEEIEKELRKVDASMKCGLVTVDMCAELKRFKEILNSNDSVIAVNFETIPLEHKTYEAVEDLEHDFRLRNVTPVPIGENTLNSPLFTCIDANSETLVLFDRCSPKLHSYNIQKKSCFSFGIDQAFSVLQFDHQTLLVSSPHKFEVSLIKIVDGKPSDTVSWKLKAKPYALCRLSMDTFVVATQEPAGFQFFKIFDTQLILISHLTKDPTGTDMKPAEYFAVDTKRSHLIQSCQEYNEISCLNFDGHQVFCFRSPVLECPQGVALDKNGNIYVCNHSYFKPSILILSPEGALKHELKDNIPRKPMSICSDTTGKKFWFTSNYIESCFSVYGFEFVKIEDDCT